MDYFKTTFDNNDLHISEGIIYNPEILNQQHNATHKYGTITRVRLALAATSALCYYTKQTFF